MAIKLVVIVVVAAFLSHVHQVQCSLGREITNKSCPTWFYLSEEGQCTCGSSLLYVIICSNTSQKVAIQDSFCLTSLTPDQDHKEPVVGRCLYAQNHGEYIDGRVGSYVVVDQNLSQQNHQLCDYLNREGRLCGACKEDHFVSPYSYDLRCYHCHSGLLSNILIYLTVAYVPLTVFLVVVVVFRLLVTSPQLHMAILMCQTYSLPISLRFLTQRTRNTTNYPYVQFIATLYGIWNLDFFRTLVPPICLPLTTLQVIALDYLVAVYPLLLLVCFYVLVRAHGRGCRLVVRLWKPFLWCSERFTLHWNAKKSIIHAFATFLMLSYLKFISISGDLLIVTLVYNIRGSQIGHFMYYDATVEFMGHQHIPFFIMALAVVSVLILFILLLLVYPMKWFQVLLNKFNLNSPGFRMFMECFQGYYRDRTDGGWECRYFAALYPTLRIGTVIIYAVTQSDAFFPIFTLFITVSMLTIFLVNPYKPQFSSYNKVDVVLLSSLVAFCASVTVSFSSADWIDVDPAFGFVLGQIIFLIPLLYLVGLVFLRGRCFYFLKRTVHVFKTKRLLYQLLPTPIWLWKTKQQDIRSNEEYEELNDSANQ